MKRLAGLGLIIGLLSLPIPTRAQVLTQEAATCVLDVIWFRVLVVTGENLGYIPWEMLPVWRNYLANRPDRYSFANTCSSLDKRKSDSWQQMSQVERELWQNMWATSLPNDLALIEPVFPGAALQLRGALQARAAQQDAAPTPMDSQEAAAEIQRRIQNMQQLNSFNRNFYGR